MGRRGIVRKLNDKQRELASENYKMIYSAANRWYFRNTLSTFEECYDACMDAYMKAVTLYDESKGCKFSTFYYEVAKGFILKAMRDAKAQKRLANQNTISIFREVSGDTEKITLMDLMESKENQYAVIENFETLKTVWHLLDETERYCIAEYYFNGRIQSEIAATMGNTQVHVSRKIKEGIKKMRNELEGELQHA